MQDTFQHKDTTTEIAMLPCSIELRRKARKIMEEERRRQPYAEWPRRSVQKLCLFLQDPDPDAAYNQLAKIVSDAPNHRLVNAIDQSLTMRLGNAEQILDQARYRATYIKAETSDETINSPASSAP